MFVCFHIFLHISIYVLHWRPKCKPIPTANRALHRSHNDLVLNPSQPLRTSSRLNNMCELCSPSVWRQNHHTSCTCRYKGLDGVILVEGSQNAQQAHKWCWINVHPNGTHPALCFLHLVTLSSPNFQKRVRNPGVVKATILRGSQGWVTYSFNWHSKSHLIFHYELSKNLHVPTILNSQFLQNFRAINATCAGKERKDSELPPEYVMCP